MSVFLQLLGSPRTRVGRRWQDIECDRPNTLLVYLALRGDWVPRAELRCLFWPDADEQSAQSNLRQLLVRARTLPHADPLEIEPRRLRYVVLSDVKHFAEVTAAHRWSEALRTYRGDLCVGWSLQDASLDADWLSRHREQLRNTWRTVLFERSRELERDGAHAQACDLYRHLVDQDLLDEEAVAALMRCSLLAGQRETALELYAQFEHRLRDELDLEPLETTRQLVRDIRNAAATSKPVTSKPVTSKPATSKPTGDRQELRPAPAKPPPGRSADWERLEQAWQNGQLVFVAGEAGIGKSRLMHDFAASKGAFTQFVGHPGDRSVPFAAVARFLRQHLTRHPQPGWPEWVRTELAQLLPELNPGASAQVGEATRPPTARLRLLEAITHALLDSNMPAGAMLLDDAHQLDDASLELVAFAAATVAPEQPMPHGLIAYRTEEASRELEDLVRRFVTAGQAVLIELGPLGQTGLAALIGELAMTGPTPAPEVLEAHTGGNPFFAAQVLRALRPGTPVLRATDLPIPQEVKRLVVAHLERLSAHALQLIRLAALTGNDFRPCLAERVLELSPLTVGQLLQDLERASLIAAHRFKADLIRRVVLETMPTTCTSFLCSRVADTLEVRGGDAARVAAYRQQAFAAPAVMAR